MRSLALDPSVNNVGWSIYDPKQSTKKKAWKWGTIRVEGSNLEMKIMDLAQQIESFARSEGEMPEFLITERPAFFSSERGQIAAHLNYTIDLSAINYFFAGWFRYDHRHHFAITANQWKGCISKAITAKRFFREFPKVDPMTLSEHAIDSIMMHRFAIQQFISTLPLALRESSPEEWLSKL